MFRNLSTTLPFKKKKEANVIKTAIICTLRKKILPMCINREVKYTSFHKVSLIPDLHH